MVQVISSKIIPERRKPSYLESLLGGIAAAGKDLGPQFLKQAQENQRKQQYEESLRSLQGIYDNPDLTPEQKYIKSFAVLKDFPEVAKQFHSGLESPLQRAQRQKLELEMTEGREENSYLDQLLRGGQEPSPQPGIEMAQEGDYLPGKEREFDSNDPTSWTDQQIDKFRSIQGKTAKAKTLASRAQNEFERRQDLRKRTEKYTEAATPLEGALGILDEMERLGKAGNLGIGTSVRRVISPKTRREAAEYERLGKSLISYASNIPIRNRQEFETLAHDLYDPSISDDARMGILAAMRRIIQNSIQSLTPPEGMESQSRVAVQKTPTGAQKRPPLQSFYK